MPEIVNINEEVYDACIKYDYTENVTFINGTSDSQDSTLKTEYLLGEGTEFFIYRFRAFNVSDEIKITLTSENLNEDVGLDWWVVGNNESDETNELPFTYKTKTTGNSPDISLVRAISLRKFNISEGDKINIEITPGSGETNWVLNMGCANNLNCGEICTMSDYFKLDLNTIQVLPDYKGPNTVRMVLDKPCVNTKVNSSFFGLISFPYNTRDFNGNECRTIQNSTNYTCQETKEPYSLKKEGNTLTFKFNSIEDLNLYTDSFYSIFNTPIYSDDPNEPSYYGYLDLRYNRVTESNGCGSDLNDWAIIKISPKCNTEVNEGDMTFKIFLTSYTKPQGFDICDNTIDTINNLLTSTSDFEYDYTTNKTISITPFTRRVYAYIRNNLVNYFGYYFELNNFSNETRPFTLNQPGTTTIPNLPQFNDRVIDSDEIFIEDDPQSRSIRYTVSNYRVTFESNLLDYTISTLFINNQGVGESPYIDIYQFVGGVGTILNPDYIKQ